MNRWRKPRLRFDDPEVRTRWDTLRRHFRAVRQAMGLSLGDVEKLTGILRSQVHRIETGRVAEPGADHIMALALVYGMTPNDVAAWLGYLPEGAPQAPCTLPPAGITLCRALEELDAEDAASILGMALQMAVTIARARRPDSTS